MRTLLALLALPVIAAAANDCAIDGIAVTTVGGAPVPRVEVTLLGPSAGRTARADGNGRWSFVNLACGSMVVTGVRPGFLQNILSRNALAVKPVTLVSGAPVHDYKLEMVPQAVLTGKVVDEQGDPMMNVTVAANLSQVLNGRRAFQNVNGIQTNDLGEFRLANLAAGRYNFCANPATNSPDSFGTLPAQSCYALDMSPGSEMRVNFTLTRVPAVHIRGVISGNQPGARAAVMLLSPGEAYSNHPASYTPDGHFDISGVRPGSYVLNADTNTGKDDMYARIPLQVGASDIDNLVLRLEPTLEIPITVKVESHNGNTVKGPFRVMLRRSQDGVPSAFRIARITSEPNGNMAFTVSGVTPGPVLLDASPPKPFYVKSPVEFTISTAAPIEMVLSDDGGAVEGDIDGPPCGVMLLRDGRARETSTNEAGHFKLAGLPPGDYVAYAWSGLQEAEYANPEWLRKYTGVPVTINPGQTSTLKLAKQ